MRTGEHYSGQWEDCDMAAGRADGKTVSMAVSKLLG